MSQPPTGNPAFFGQKVSKPGVNVNNAGPTELVYQNDYTTTTYYDNANSRILLGQLPDNSYGMWVSQPGVNVTTATISQLIFNSNEALFKILATGTATLNLTATAQAGPSTIVPHGLGYAPYIQGFVNIQAVETQNEWSPLPYFTINFNFNGSLTFYTSIQIFVDATNVYIFPITSTNTVAGIYVVQYYLVQPNSGQIPSLES